MALRVSIPDNIVAHLKLSGEDLERRTLEALAIDGYCSGDLSLGQVAEVLGLSVDEADGFLKKRHIPRFSGIDDFDNDQRTLEDLLRQ